MVFIGDRVRTMDALVWSRKSKPGANGMPLFDEPRAIKVLWIDNREIRQTPDGSSYLTNAKILVGEDIKLDDFMMLGSSEDIPKFDAPRNPQRCGAARIVDFKKVTHPKQKKIVRIAYT